MTELTYRQQILDWRKEREHGFRRENGWLALAGLFWLKQGPNRIGSDPACAIRLPTRAPAWIGDLELNGDAVRFQPALMVKVKINDKPAKPVILKPDTSADPTFITVDDLCLVVIQHGARLGVRLWDNQRAERRERPPRRWYEIDPSFRFSGRYSPYASPSRSLFPDVSGEIIEENVAGFISFEHQDKPYRLDVTMEKDGSLFIRFWDPTSKTTSYPSGRYLTANPGDDGSLILDFNYSYNPPCAFTEYATCVFAPEQNRLDFEIQAGEAY